MPTEDATSPPVGETERQRSDLFWEELSWIGTGGDFRYESIEDMTRDVHLIVTGRVVGIDKGLLYPYEANPLEGATPRPYDVLLLLVEVDEVLKGEPMMRAPGVIQIRLHGGDERLLVANSPTHEHIFFLMNDAQLRLDLGYPLWDAENERMTYGRPNGFQAVIRNIGDKVAVIRPDHPDGDGAQYFPLQLDRTPFADVMDEIRTATSR